MTTTDVPEDLPAPVGPPPTAADPAQRQRKRLFGKAEVSHRERHAAIGTTGWLRPFVLGAEDGIVSTAGLVIGVAAAGGSRSALLAAGLAGVGAGALSMAAGEYVSVAAQRDVEHADIARETWELANEPEDELEELTRIYEGRGLHRELAEQVARELTERDALTTHLREELAIDRAIVARPWQAAWLSAVSFTVGAVVPVIAILASPESVRMWVTVVITLLVLAGAGALAGQLGRSSVGRGSVRVMVGGALAMLVTWAIGTALGTTGI
jgi:VIT1/CCC1 family predicted Fe2+/Mn2+ transporter